MDGSGPRSAELPTTAYAQAVCSSGGEFVFRRVMRSAACSLQSSLPLPWRRATGAAGLKHSMKQAESRALEYFGMLCLSDRRVSPAQPVLPCQPRPRSSHRARPALLGWKAMNGLIDGFRKAVYPRSPKGQRHPLSAAGVGLYCLSRRRRWKKAPIFYSAAVHPPLREARSLPLER